MQDLHGGHDVLRLHRELAHAIAGIGRQRQNIVLRERRYRLGKRPATDAFADNAYAAKCLIPRDPAYIGSAVEPRKPRSGRADIA